MPSPIIADSLDAIPEAERVNYTKRESDGKFINLLAVEDTTGLKNKNSELLASLAAMKDSLKKFEGIDPEKARGAMTAAEKAAEDAAKAEGKWDEWKQQLVTKHEAELVAERTKATQMQGFIEELLIDATLGKELAEAKGNALFLMPHLRKAARVVADEKATSIKDAFRVIVVDEKGNERIGDAKGNPMTLKALVGEFKADERYANAFDGSGSTGGGAPGSRGAPSGGSTGTVRSRADFRTPAEHVAFIKAHGQEAYQALPLTAAAAAK